MLDEGNPLWGAVPELTPGTEVAGFTVEGTIASEVKAAAALSSSCFFH
ncbi:MAG TPA: hypothetical protein VFZ09_48100 [Archangium sp.]|nr:hypothetical protein [Archangium sp.]HEX5754040.1 hypothetical protein [Archangium sp.]